jgi:hypothetical protein
MIPQKKKTHQKCQKQVLVDDFFSLTISKIEVDVRFLDAESDVKGSEGSRTVDWAMSPLGGAMPCSRQAPNRSTSDWKLSLASHKRVERASYFCYRCEELVCDRFDVHTEVA